MFENEKINEIIDTNDLAGIVVDVCATLYHNGIDYVHVGGLMRLLGVSEDQASEHDTTYFHLDENFVEQLKVLEDLEIDSEQMSLNLADSVDDDTPPTVH